MTMSRLCFFVPDPANPEWFRALTSLNGVSILNNPEAFPQGVFFLPEDKPQPDVLHEDDKESLLYGMMLDATGLREDAIKALSERFVKDKSFRKESVQNVLSGCLPSSRSEATAAFRKALEACETGSSAAEAVADVFRTGMEDDTLAHWFGSVAAQDEKDPACFVRRKLVEMSINAYQLGDKDTAPVWVHKSFVEKHGRPVATHADYIKARNLDLYGTEKGPESIRFAIPGRIPG